MIKKPLYTFDNGSSVGLDTVPLNATLMIENYNGEALIIILTSSTSITNSTTITTLIETLPSNYTEISGGIGKLYDSSIAISADDTALVLDDETDNNNIAIGNFAGAAVTTGSKNVLIGYQAGNTLTSSSNQLKIANNGSDALVNGDFNTKVLSINGDLYSHSPVNVSSRVTVTDTTESGTSPIFNIVTLTQASYDALTPVATTLYVIVG